MTTKNLPGLEFGARNIFCIGRNYADHAKELKNEVPAEPIVFLKPVSALCFSGATVTLPAQSARVDHEVEIVVAIGRSQSEWGGGPRIVESRALEWVAGYAVGIDLTARDLQEKAKAKGLPWAIAKGFDGFAPVSQFVAPGQVGALADLEFQLEVNGELRQQGNTRDMLFSIPRLISYLSEIFTLSTGDLIFTGTPKGVAPLHAGDVATARLGPGNGFARLEIQLGAS